MKTWKDVGWSELFRQLSAYTNGHLIDDLDPEAVFEFGDVEWHEIYCSEWEEVDGFRFRRIDEYGGEDQGNAYWFVMEVEFADQIKAFEISGYYASYDGGYYEDIKEVKPQDKVITVWVTA